MEMQTNSLLEWVDTQEEPRVDRILSKKGNQIALIDIFAKNATPTLHLKTEIQELVESGVLRILNKEPFETNKPEASIPESHKEIRDTAWNLIQNIVVNPLSIWDKQYRWKLATETAQTIGKDVKQIYRYLLKFWQRGQVPNALLPNYSQGSRSSVEHKPGRKGIVSGIAITTDVEKKFALGIKAFYETRKKPSLKEAYRETLRRYFNSGYEVRNGNTIPILPPADQLPTMRQFRYWFKKQRDPEKSLKLREGGKFALKHRSITGESTGMSFGPGSLYQIDSTIGDIYLVSTLDRTKLVGRPTLYIVMDVFSRCFAGFNLTLEEPSHAQAALAIENAIQNKVDYCKEQGIQIDTEDWPCEGVPESILADRGELKGPIADQIVMGLGIRLDNTPPYRADLKGIVERSFGIGNQRLFHFLPGAVQGKRERGDADPRIEAIMDINQLRRLVIMLILDHNRKMLSAYPKKEFHIEDEVRTIPSELWAWGISRCGGALKHLPPQTVKTLLLPQSTAGVTPKGIHFKKAFYTCPMAIEEQWFVRSREGKGHKVKVAYDPRDAGILYVETQNGMEACTLLGGSSIYQGKPWAEMLLLHNEQHKVEILAEHEAIQREATLKAEIKQTIQAAKEMLVPGSRTKTQKTQGIKANRRAELAETRQTAKQAANPEPDNDPSYIGPPSYANILEEQLKKSEK